MSDISLKKITIDSVSPLIIQNGNILITDTSVSTSMITGSLISNGGLAINCTFNSISSTSGGAVTIGGGLSVAKQIVVGGNIILDNSSNVFNINGLTENRLFLDSVANKNFYISPDGISRRFDLYDNILKINITNGSFNSSTGALVITGGISINSTFDSVNSSNGGALTVAGGSSFGGNVIINKSLNIGNGLINKYTGTTGTQIILNGTIGSSNINMIDDKLTISSNSGISLFSTTGSIIINNATINNTNNTFSKYIYIADTIESINSSTGSLIVNGGLSINCTTDSSSITNGGGITISGGMSISKKIFTGDSINLEVNNSNKSNKLILYQNGSDFTGLGITVGSLRLQVPSNSDYIFYSNTSEVFRIKGTNEVQFQGSTQKYSILGGSQGSLALQSQNIATDSSFNLFTRDGDSNDNNDFKIYSLGLPNNTSNSEYLQLGWSKNNLNYNIKSNFTGTGSSRNLVLQTGFTTLNLNTNGNITLNSTSVSINSSTGSLILNGGLSINCNILASSLTQGGSVTVLGGGSFSGNMYIGTTLNLNNIQFSSQSGSLLTQTSNTSFVFAGLNNTTVYPSNLSLFSLNNQQSTDYELLNIQLTNSNTTGYWNINSGFGGIGNIRAIQLGVNTFKHITLNTNGNVGINNQTPNYTLDVNGNFNATSYSYINGLTIYNTQDSVNSTTAALVVTGGIGIKGKLINSGIAQFQNILRSINSSTGSVVISGGLSINGSNNSTNVSSGGALTVQGGAAVGGDLYIGGTIYYANSASVSNSYAYLRLTSTDQSININNGSLITFGGISIQSTMDATSTTSGGGLTVIGGIATNNSLYIGGNINTNGVAKFRNTSSGNFIQYIDVNGIQRFSIDLATTNNFTISRYTNLGLIDSPFEIINSTGTVRFNNTITSTSNGTGSMLAMGGITINCSTNSTTLGNGGALSVFGGASISKQLFVGGNAFFTSTTVSNDISSGSVLISGGVGIGGNLNILGDTVISGNLTIMGTTTSIHTTNTLLTDNIVVLNSGPSGSKDSGLLIQRYQFDNDTGTGDVVNDNPYLYYTLPLQSGMNNNQVKLNASSSLIDNFYTGWYIKITSGFSNNQVRQIISYIGSSRVATLSTPFTTQNPTLGDSISLYNKPFVGLIYSEINHRFEFGSSLSDPGQTSVTFTDHLPILFSSAISTSTQQSTNNTTGAIITSGGLSINNTTDALNISSGGGCTIAGGMSVAKTVYIGKTCYVNGVNITPNIYDTPSTVTFTAANVTVPTNITGLAFNNSVWGSDIYITTQIQANTNYYTNSHLKCVNKGTYWDIVTDYIGDNVVSFGITSTGQIQYVTSTTFPGFTSCIFKYKVMTN